MRRRFLCALVALSSLAASCAYRYETRDFNLSIPESALSSFIYDSRGEQITLLRTPENRVYKRIDEIPKVLKDAVVATEDERLRVEHQPHASGHENDAAGDLGDDLERSIVSVDCGLQMIAERCGGIATDAERGRLELRDVGFRYPGAEHAVQAGDFRLHLRRGRALDAAPVLLQ